MSEGRLCSPLDKKHRAPSGRVREREKVSRQVGRSGLTRVLSGQETEASSSSDSVMLQFGLSSDLSMLP